MPKSTSWFDVSKEGLRQLQEGKPKHWILRELIQNSFDEPITECIVEIKWERGIAEIVVTDDSPEGFRDISHAFTLFAPTYKRAEPEKRGRYNLGEKQVLSLCDEAKIETTKGTVIFGKKGRIQTSAKTQSGSKITVYVKMILSEYQEIIEIVHSYLVPKGISFIVNNELIGYRQPYKTFETTLPTEFEVNGVFRKTQRKTKVDIHIPNGKSFLYEMGIPVLEIDCKYSMNVQQKVPLSVDRDTVPPSFLSVLYAEVLNNTFTELKSEESSSIWIREGSANTRINPEAIKTVINRRYGDKVVVANPTDKNSIDEAISHGFKVVYGSELSKEEWDNVKKTSIMPSSTELFGSNITTAETIEPSPQMLKFADLSKRIAKRFLGIDITVRFAKWDGVTAQYGNRTLTLNVQKLNNGFFTDTIVTARQLNLIIHELGHEDGNHTEHSYHELITKLAGELIIKALEDREFFIGVEE